MKRCFKCGETKAAEEFYRHPMMGDGRLGKCKVCTRRDVQENRERKQGYYLAYERRRYRDNPARRRSLAASRKRYPMRDRARVHLHNAVARGKINKGPCEVCGATRVDGHHEDYSKPLEVRWLCRKHHMEHHRMERK